MQGKNRTSMLNRGHTHTVGNLSGGATGSAPESEVTVAEGVAERLSPLPAFTTTESAVVVDLAFAAERNKTHVNQTAAKKRETAVSSDPRTEEGHGALLGELGG